MIIVHISKARRFSKAIDVVVKWGKRWILVVITKRPVTHSHSLALTHLRILINTSRLNDDARCLNLKIRPLGDTL